MPKIERWSLSGSGGSSSAETPRRRHCRSDVKRPCPSGAVPSTRNRPSRHIRVTHEQFRQAEERLRRIDDAELSWQIDVESLGRRVNHLRAEHDVATEAIRRRRLLEAQMRKLRQELGP